MMKIEVAPWIRDYVVEMQELYCELMLEEVACKPRGMQRTIVEHYQELFDFEDKGPNKILAKGEPGMGKTTWVKKIAWDWAKKNFEKFSLILLVYLKLVQPGDTLEYAMIHQIPELEGLHVSPTKLESFIEHFGERCLLILDGLDEHAYGSNKDVGKVLQHRKYLNCNILITSRPHSTAEIQGSCQTVVSVEGFTPNEARKFASLIVKNERAVEQILDFNPTGGKQDVVLHKCPILLSFMCILVTEKAVDLTNKTMPTGEIYTRMIQCLYKKFTIRRGIAYDDVKFTEVVGLVAKLAWETLLSGKPLFERSRVEREVGKDAFDYGFLIGHEDLISHVKADILITFAHRSIQEFFGAFGFVSLLNNREHGLLDLESKDHIVLKNPLFLHFCFWFLSDRCNREYFSAADMKTACSNLYTYVHQRIERKVLDLRHIAVVFPAVNILGSLHSNDDVNKVHFGRILEMLDTIQCITLRHYDPIDWILDHIKATPTFIVVDDDSKKSQLNVFPELFKATGNDLNIVLSGKACTTGIIKSALERAALWERRLTLYLILTGDGKKSIELSDILHQDMHKLHVIGTARLQSKVTARSDLVSCPFLTHLSIIGSVAIHGSVMLSLSKAVREGKLSSLKSFNFVGTGLKGRIGNLFDGKAILSNVTDLSFYDVDNNDIEALSQNWTNATHLAINTLTKSGFRTVMKSLGQGVLTSLNKLCLSMIDNETIDLEAVNPENLPQLEHLGLQRCIASKEALERLSHLATNWSLNTLDISHSRGIKGKLSLLLQHKFPSLKSLILNDCKLNDKDLRTVDQANADGRLPMLEDLNLSQNYRLIGNVDTMLSKWIHLKRLNLDHQQSSHGRQLGLEILGKLISNDCIPSMQELRLAVHSAHFVQNKTVIQRPLQYLQRLDIVFYTHHYISDCLEHIRFLKERGNFPTLEAVCVLTDNVPRDDVSGNVSTYILPFRTIGLELYLIEKDLEKQAVDSGLI